jgi:hypothetical protein
MHARHERMFWRGRDGFRRVIAGGEDRAHVPPLQVVGAACRSRSQGLRGGRFGSLTHQDAGRLCRGLQQGWVEAGYRLQGAGVCVFRLALPCHVPDAMGADFFVLLL